jgi:hypothetical protein
MFFILYCRLSGGLFENPNAQDADRAATTTTTSRCGLWSCCKHTGQEADRQDDGVEQLLRFA